jgi:hypothetical protein
MAMKQDIHKVGDSPSDNILTPDAQKVQGSTPSNRARLMGGTARGRAKDPVTIPTTRDLIKGRSTLRPESTDIDFRDKFKSSKQFFQKEDVTRPSKELKIGGDTTSVTRVGAQGRSPRGKDAEALKKTVTPFEALEKGGQSKLMQARLNRFSKAGSGEKFKGGGSFSISGTTRAQESRLGSGGEAYGGSARGAGKAPSPFSQKGMEAFFGNMESLASKILSPEYQKQVASARTAATTRKGKLADTKAKTDRMKAYGSMIKDLSESGGNEDVIKMLESKITTEGIEEDIDPMAKFASQLAEMGLPREQISQIAGIIEGGVKR